MTAKCTPVINSLSQEGFLAMGEDINYALSTIAEASAMLTSVADLARALAPFGHGDSYELINMAICELSAATTDLKQALSIVSPDINL